MNSFGKDRTVEILRNGQFVKDEFENIKQGDKFKIYEPDGELIKITMDSGKVVEILKASSDAFMKNGIMTVIIEGDEIIND